VAEGDAPAARRRCSPQDADLSSVFTFSPALSDAHRSPSRRRRSPLNGFARAHRPRGTRQELPLRVARENASASCVRSLLPKEKKSETDAISSRAAPRAAPRSSCRRCTYPRAFRHQTDSVRSRRRAAPRESRRSEHHLTKGHPLCAPAPARVGASDRHGSASRRSRVHQADPAAAGAEHRVRLA